MLILMVYIQLSIFRDTKNNITCKPTGRRYSDIVKEFAVTLNHYSPKAYDYVRSIMPLPHPSLIRKWCSLLRCEPGFIKESFQSLGNDAKTCHEKKDCCLILDAMSTICMQSSYGTNNKLFSEFKYSK